MVAPDASVAAVLIPTGAKASTARGPVIDAGSGRALPGARVVIDDGTAHENGAPQAVACLLPHGEGVIYTALGAPADRVSSFQRFPIGRAAPVELKGPYVTSCLSVRP